MLLDIDYGLVIGMGISTLMIIFRDQHLHMRSLMEYQSKGGFMDQEFLVTDKICDVISSLYNFLL